MNKKAVKQQKKTGAPTKGKLVSLPPGETEAAKSAAKASAAGTATRIELDYIFGSSSHCFWATVGSKSCYRWLNDDQVKTIAHAAFMAPQVFIEYDSTSGQIARIRPKKPL